MNPSAGWTLRSTLWLVGLLALLALAASVWWHRAQPPEEAKAPVEADSAQSDGEVEAGLEEKEAPIQADSGRNAPGGASSIPTYGINIKLVLALERSPLLRHVLRWGVRLSAAELSLALGGTVSPMRVLRLYEKLSLLVLRYAEFRTMTPRLRAVVVLLGAMRSGPAPELLLDRVRWGWRPQEQWIASWALREIGRPALKLLIAELWNPQASGSMHDFVENTLKLFGSAGDAAYGHLECWAVSVGQAHLEHGGDRFDTAPEVWAMAMEAMRGEAAILDLFEYQDLPLLQYQALRILLRRFNAGEAVSQAVLEHVRRVRDHDGGHKVLREQAELIYRRHAERNPDRERSEDSVGGAATERTVSGAQHRLKA